MISATLDVTDQFRRAIEGAGLTPPESIEADGKLRRFASNGKRSDDSGWYVLHDDGIPAGSFGDWRTGFSQTWRADIGRKLTQAEEAEHRKRIEAMRHERDAARARDQADAADKAATVLQSSKPAPADHPYLMRKNVGAHGVRVYGKALVVPMRADGKLCGVQFIGADGDKKFMRGARTSSAYFSVGNPKGAQALCIAEGFATGASIYEATGYPVAVAFNAGNLEAVAVAMRAKFPDLRLIVCADDDYRTDGNPGMTKARAAAQAVGALLAVPGFGSDRPDGATDFNDMAAAHGLEAVKRAVEAAQALDVQSDQAAQESPSRADFEAARAVELVRGDTLTPEPVQWLWDGWLAAGKLHILGGQPGTGKTTLALALAASITTAGRWPDGRRSGLGSVVIWSGEDDPADTLVPRLHAMGADLRRVHFVGDVGDAEGKRAFDPSRDVDALFRSLAGIDDVRLLIVDPIVSAVAADSHKNAEVRRGLAPLVELAACMRCAVLGITHFTKGTSGREPVERITGSLAFGALARVVLVAAKKQADDGDKSVRMLMRAKSNIGPDDGAFEYDIEQAELAGHPGVIASHVRWGAAVDGTARELLAAAEQEDDERSASDEAFDTLREILSDGRVEAKVANRKMSEAGFTDKQTRRAREALDIKPRREGFGADSKFWWALPPLMPSPPIDAHCCPTKSVGINDINGASMGTERPEGTESEVEL